MPSPPSHPVTPPAVGRAPDTSAAFAALLQNGGPRELLGTYRLVELLATEDTGPVFRARHRLLPLTLRIKILGGGDEAGVRARLAELGPRLLRLDHAHVARLWDFDAAGLFPYLVTEDVRGPSLAELMRRHDRLAEEWGLQLFLEAVNGLAAAEQFGVHHLGLCPENLRLTCTGHVKVADLGLETILGPRWAVDPSSSHLMQMRASTYLAPEQAAEAGPVDHRADMYSLGAVFYHALCGRPPFQGTCLVEVVLKHLQQEPLPPSQLVTGLRPAVSDLLLRLLAKRPADRFATYDDLRAAVRGLLQ